MTNKQMENKIRQAFQNVTPDRANSLAAQAILSDQENRKGAEKPMKTVKTSIQFRAIATLAASIAVVILVASALLIRNPDPGPSAQPGESTGSTQSTLTSTGAEGNFIGIDAALVAANTYAANWNLPPLTTENVKWELDEEDGKFYYEIEVRDGNREIEFVIDAQTGNMMGYDVHTEETGWISEEEAIEIALNHAKVAREDALITVACELGDVTPYYDIEIWANGKEYDYEISVYDGTILDADVEDNDVPPVIDPPVPDGNIGKDLAIQTALQSLGITDKELVTDLECDAEPDEKTPHYDVSFDYNGFEYEIEVAMFNPTVLNTEKEPIAKPPAPTGIIQKDLAIQNALESVGISDKTLVTDLECEDDEEANYIQPHYDISFDYNGFEYEIEVSMYTGAVLKTEKEPIN